MSPEEILDAARGKGLDGVCITDHDTQAVLGYITPGIQSDGLLVVVGMEYATPQGDYLLFGDIGSIPQGLPAAQMLVQVRDNDGAAISAHPFRVARPADAALVKTDLVSIVEVENGRNRYTENDLARALASRHNKIVVAGSDAHRLDELGVCPTRFTVPVRSEEDLILALNQGRCRPAHLPGKIA